MPLVSAVATRSMRYRAYARAPQKIEDLKEKRVGLLTDHQAVADFVLSTRDSRRSGKVYRGCWCHWGSVNIT